MKMIEKITKKITQTASESVKETAKKTITESIPIMLTLAGIVVGLITIGKSSKYGKDILGIAPSASSVSITTNNYFFDQSVKNDILKGMIEHD